jgi:hypothetical protein
MLPTTGFVGGCGIGLNLLLDAIVEVSPALREHRRHPRTNALALAREERALARVSKDGREHHFLILRGAPKTARTFG